MKFIIQTLFVIFASWVSVLFLPWYSIAGVAFLAGYFFKSKANFLAGFTGIGLLWVLNFWISKNDSELPQIVAEIFQIKKEIGLLAVASILAGITAGFACLTGSLLKMEKKRKFY